MDKETSWGPRIKVDLGEDYDYVVKIEHKSNFDPKNPGDCKVYNSDDFEKCVDKELQDVWKPALGCNPPWLSPQDQCTRVINYTKDIVDNIYLQKRFSIINRIVRMESYPAREKCTIPCTFTQSNFFLGEKYSHSFRSTRTLLKFKFAKKVIHKTKLLGYGYSEFLIDLGSSLGLWFGLSVFGISDLGIMALQWAKTFQLDASKKLFK